MAKQKVDLIAFDPITRRPCPSEQLPKIYNPDYKQGVSNDYYIPHPDYVGLELLWVDNLPFYAKLKFEGIRSTYSGSATACLTDIETGIEYTMYANEFNEVIDWFIEGGILEGCWKFKRKGQRDVYPLVGVELPEGV